MWLIRKRMNCLLKNSGSHKGQGKSVHWKQKFWKPACCCKFITRKPKTQRIRRKWCLAKQCVRTKTPTKAQPAVMWDGKYFPGYISNEQNETNSSGGGTYKNWVQQWFQMPMPTCYTKMFLQACCPSTQMKWMLYYSRRICSCIF